MAECLLLQVAPETPHADILRVLIRDHLDDIANNRIPVIHKATKFDIPAIHDAIEALRRLDPKPGLKFRQPPEPRQGVPPLWFPSPDFLKLSIADLQAKIAQELQENPFLELKSVAPQELLLKILAHYSVCSKEWVIRQYDHEVQSMSAVKPLVGVANDGPSDAAVIMPVLGSWAGAAVGCGINPRYGDHDPYWMAANAIDEAVRNVVAVGADPRRTAILDNFCWGNVNDPAVLGALVRTAEACRDVAVAFGAPFVSGKDSLNNTYAGKTGERLDIPHTLLVSALGRVPDIRQCVTMDLKEAGNRLYVVGNTRDELGGSHLHVVTGRVGGNVPRVDLELAPRIFAAVHTAITRGLVRACHDLSEGGLAVALAEMAFAGGLGVDFTGLGQLPGADGLSDEARLFSESPTRFILEVKPENAAAFEACFVGLPVGHVGVVLTEPRVRLAGSGGEWLVWVKLSELKDAWQKPLRW
jgi:phosphoribosylformylglycinamidine synthase